jgi:hypothetical protein
MLIFKILDIDLTLFKSEWLNLAGWEGKAAVDFTITTNS